MNDNQLQLYLQEQKDFRIKWKDYLARPANFGIEHRVSSLTPFSGTEHDEKLTETQRNNLFIGNIKFNAECLIVFEQILLFGYFHNKKTRHFEKDGLTAPFTQFTVEELYHSMAFKNFLKIHPVFNHKDEFVTNDHGLKNAFSFVVKHFPGALYICSPRLETYTITYYAMVKKAYADAEDNSWLELHKHHHQDELFHVPLNYKFHDSFISEHGPVKTLFGSMLFLFLMQVMMIKVVFKVIASAFPEKNFLEKSVWTLRFIKWAIKVAPAHKEARTMMRRHYRKANPKYGNVFAFILW